MVEMTEVWKKHINTEQIASPSVYRKRDGFYNLNPFRKGLGKWKIWE